MPRPKSEYTKSGKTIAVRATMLEWQEWRRLGGARWLRPMLQNSIETNIEKIKKAKRDLENS
jgi:hypothetical protein